MQNLFESQVARLRQAHLLILYWAAQAEVDGLKYNITNAFDDLKDCGITRTKQSAVAFVEALQALCFADVRDENNRKNIYTTDSGAKALEILVQSKGIKTMKSRYLEGQK